MQRPLVILLCGLKQSAVRDLTSNRNIGIGPFRSATSSHSLCDLDQQVMTDAADEGAVSDVLDDLLAELKVVVHDIAYIVTTRADFAETRAGGDLMLLGEIDGRSGNEVQVIILEPDGTVTLAHI